MTYKRIVELLDEVFELLPEGVDLSKGGVGEIALASYLGHDIVKGDKGADGIDIEGNLYEYKVSTTDQFNFHFGSRNGNPGAVVTKHFNGISGAYCAKRVGMKIIEVAFISTEVLVPALIKHFSNTKGGQLNKNYRLCKFKGLNETILHKNN
jgi:hypothetical protein